jgi:hypothetical protein
MFRTLDRRTRKPVYGAFRSSVPLPPLSHFGLGVLGALAVENFGLGLIGPSPRAGQYEGDPAVFCLSRQSPPLDASTSPSRSIHPLPGQPLPQGFLSHRRGPSRLRNAEWRMRNEGDELGCFGLRRRCRTRPSGRARAEEARERACVPPRVTAAAQTLSAPAARVTCARRFQRRIGRGRAIDIIVYNDRIANT